MIGSTATRSRDTADSSSTRGATAVFPPQRQRALWQVVHQAPERFGIQRARWRLADLRDLRELPWLASVSLAGLHGMLRRQGIHLKRGRLHVHSPDPEYVAKVFALEQARALARRFPDRVRLLYADEVGCYRYPTLATRYACTAHEPTAPLPHAANSYLRVGGALDVFSGAVTYERGAKVGVRALCALLSRLRARYPDQILVLAWDNWPVHKHAQVLATAAKLRIHLKWLPTYAPWTNPIEKLWRWLKQTHVHHHQKADRWPAFQADVVAFLDRFTAGSTDLLRYAGLSSD